jgi:tetratricopeptide (TPR) repeat protein
MIANGAAGNTRFTFAGDHGVMPDTLQLLQRALAAHRDGRPAEAEGVYRDILWRVPDEPHALHCLGLLTLADGRVGEALDLLARAERVWPDHDGIALALVRALLAAGRVEEGVARARALADRRPLCAAPLATLALARLRVADPAGALAEAEAALALDPACGDAWFAAGTALSQLRRPAEAVARLERAVACAPDHAEARLNLGNSLYDLDRLEAAEAHLRCAIRLDPSLAEAHASLGCLLSGDGRLAEAVACCAAAIALRPDFAQAHWNQSFAHMLAGDWAEGWEKYEWRKRHDVFARHLMLLPGPQWQGEELQGRVLLVRAEQGLGDTIQFARYLPLLVARGAKVVLVCATPLIALLRQIEDVTVMPPGTVRPEYDLWIDQMSLPRLFGTRLDTIPDAAGFLSAASARVARWRQALPRGFRVGVVWAGNPNHSNDRRRSMAVDALAPLLESANARIRDVRFFSLQVGPDSGAITLRFGIADRSSLLPDLAETAAFVSALDLVIAVDSCVAHLAGALGVKVWILLPFAPDWRWMTGRSDTPWYASAKLFRQTRPGDWSGPVERVAAELARLAGPARAAAASASLRPPVSPPRRMAPSAPASRNRPAASPSPAPG